MGSSGRRWWGRGIEARWVEAVQGLKQVTMIGKLSGYEDVEGTRISKSLSRSKMDGSWRCARIWSRRDGW